MNIKCNNYNCANQYGGDCTAMEHIKLMLPAGAKEEYLTHCTAFCSEYVQTEGELKSFSERNIFCERKDCRYNTAEVIGKCKRKAVKVIAGLYGDSECRCINFERREEDG
ncbi:MAG: hypothetical protein BWY15_00452 [Firmicutes bacterium ADurb.Bin193]|nr:MAG: hypothetical protein BWY15_00452 [Firmicutes bacterium ADurb.Bin193]